MIALVSASLACNAATYDASGAFVEGAIENCKEGDRASYESVMTLIGKSPVDPRYPETATYEVCCSRISGEPSSARIICGDKPPIRDQADSESGDQTAMDQPAETQAGETGVEMNEENIQLDEQGSIEGASVLLFKIYVDTDGNGRLERELRRYWTGEVTGQMNEMMGEMVISYKWLLVIVGAGGDEDSCRQEQQVEIQYDLEITDGVITAKPGEEKEKRVPFELSKQ